MSEERKEDTERRKRTRFSLSYYRKLRIIDRDLACLTNHFHWSEKSHRETSVPLSQFSAGVTARAERNANEKARVFLCHFMPKRRVLETFFLDWDGKEMDQSISLCLSYLSIWRLRLIGYVYGLRFQYELLWPSHIWQKKKKRHSVPRRLCDPTFQLKGSIFSLEKKQTWSRLDQSNRLAGKEQ